MRAKARPRAIGTPAASAISRQNALELSIRAAAAAWSEDREPGLGQAVRHAGREWRLGPDDDQLGREPAGQRDDRRRIEWVDRGAADARLRGDPVGTRRDEDLVDAGLSGQLPGEGVLAAAATDDQDPGRLDELAHAPASTRWRIGRHARSIVCVRSGPTDTSTIGAPACSSSAVT